MKVKLYLVLTGLIIGAALGVPVGMNVERDAPVMSNPFAERADRASLPERVKQGADKAMAATKEGARKAIDVTKQKVHEATKPDDQN